MFPCFSSAVPRLSVRIRKVGLQLQSSPEAGGCLVEMFLPLQNDAKVVVRVGIVGLQRHGPPTTGGCLGQLTLALQHGAEIVVRVDILGIQLDGSLTGNGRFVQQPLLGPDGAEVLVAVLQSRDSARRLDGSRRLPRPIVRPARARRPSNDGPRRNPGRSAPLARFMVASFSLPRA